MDIGKLDDAEAVEGRGKVADIEGGVCDLEFVAADLVRVEREPGGGGYKAGEEFAAGDDRGHSLKDLRGESSHSP